MLRTRSDEKHQEIDEYGAHTSLHCFGSGSTGSTELQTPLPERNVCQSPKHTLESVSTYRRETTLPTVVSTNGQEDVASTVFQCLSKELGCRGNVEFL